MATGYKLDMDFKLLKDFFKLLDISLKKKKRLPSWSATFSVFSSWFCILFLFLLGNTSDSYMLCMLTFLLTSRSKCPLDFQQASQSGFTIWICQHASILGFPAHFSVTEDKNLKGSKFPFLHDDDGDYFLLNFYYLKSTC